MFMGGAGATCTPRGRAGASSTDRATAVTMRAMDETPGAAEQVRRPDPEPVAWPRAARDPAPLPRPARPARPGAAPIAVGALVAAAGVAAIVAWGVSPRRGAAPAAEGDPGRTLEPIRARAEVWSGEQVAPFSGFAVSVETEPPGALVSIGGVPRGEAPVLAGLDCAPGARVEIAAEKGGFPVARAATTCRKDALVKLTVRLHR
jgi:hypothetical protein